MKKRILDRNRQKGTFSRKDACGEERCREWKGEGKG